MKIAHITYADTGGASIAAHRLHLSLVDKGIDSTFHVVKSIGGWEGCNLMSRQAVHSGTMRRKSGRQLQKLLNRTCRHPDLIQLQWTDCGYLAGMDESYDILHLHWADGQVASIFEIASLRTPVVWTLHDMRAFNGGHYYDGFGITKNGETLYDMHSLKSNPAVRFNQIVKRFTLGRAGLHGIAPSRWMHQEAAKSGVFRKSHLHQIPYGIGHVDHPIPLREKERAAYGLGENDKVLLYGADSLGYARKGHDLMNHALEWLEKKQPDSGDIHFFTFGKGEFTAPGNYQKNHRHFGHIRSEHQMNCLYAMADVFVAPSREDNLPNVVLESLRCGTPVAAFKIGGMPDMIRDGLNGRLATPFAPSSLGQAIHDLLVPLPNATFMSREVIISDVLDSFSLEKQADRVLDVYRQSLK